MPTDIELTSIVSKSLMEFHQKAEKVFGRRFQTPNLAFVEKMGGTAGYANYSANLIKVNLYFLRRYPDDYANTVGHELAHLVTYALYGPREGRGHGKRWKSVMVKLGLEPVRCHNYDMTELRPYLYECCNCGKQFNLSKRGHNSWQGRFHPACGSKIGKIRPVVK